MKRRMLCLEVVHIQLGHIVYRTVLVTKRSRQESVVQWALVLRMTSRVMMILDGGFTYDDQAVIEDTPCKVSWKLLMLAETSALLQQADIKSDSS